jgi:integrase
MQNLNYLADNYEQKLPLGEVQWACINTIAKRYQDVNLGKISNISVFGDPVWKNHLLDMDMSWSLTKSENGLISGYFEKNEYPLMLLCKIATYREIALLGKSFSWFKQCQSFYNFFSETLRAKSILTGNKNEVIKPLSDLTCDDIILAAQLHLAKSKGKISDAPFIFLNSLKELPFEALKEAPFFLITTELPWEVDGIGIHKWLKQLKVSEGYSISAKKSYPPISLENVSEIVKKSMFWLDNLEMLKDVFELIKLDEEKNGRTSTRNIRKTVADKILAKYEVALNELLPIRTSIQVNRRNSDITYRIIERSWFTDLIRLAHGAAIWIILLTTGLRNSDTRRLKVGFCKSSNRSDFLYYLITNIQKTGQKNYILPVPHQTKLATELLESVRRDLESSFLLTKTSFSHSKGIENRSAYQDGGTLNQLLWDFLDHYDIPRVVSETDDTEATVHCVRATLAGWVGANSHMAILIIRKLFGHSNMIMPDDYLSHNPIIIKQRQENVTNAIESLAEDMVEGMVSGKLAGTKGEQMLSGVDYVKEELRIECLSITEMDMHVTLTERLKELLMHRIVGGEVYAMLTPMAVVCMRNCNDTSDSPCAKQMNHEKRRDKSISKEITDALGTLPNPAHCVGKDCSDALFGKAWSRPLLETFQYYINYLKGMGNQSIDIKFEAEIFIREYEPILKELYEEESCFV